MLQIECLVSIYDFVQLIRVLYDVLIAIACSLQLFNFCFMQLLFFQINKEIVCCLYIRFLEWNESFYLEIVSILIQLHNRIILRRIARVVVSKTVIELCYLDLVPLEKLFYLLDFKQIKFLSIGLSH